MKWEELENDQELLDKMAAEVEEKAQGGQALIDAKIEVLKAHNIEFDEDELRASAIDQMELDEDSLKNVTGGSGERKDPFCMVNYSCYIVARHSDNDSRNHACISNYYCLVVSVCSTTQVNTEREKPWKKS